MKNYPFIILLSLSIFYSCTSYTIDSIDPPNGNSCLLIYTDVSVKNSTLIDNRIDFYDNDTLLFSILPNKNITIYRNCSPGKISISSYRIVNLFKTSNTRTEKMKFSFLLEPDTISILPFKIVIKATEYASMEGYYIDTLTFEDYDKCIGYLNKVENIDKWKIRKLNQ